jgi:hypothetical protein
LGENGWVEVDAGESERLALIERVFQAKVRSIDIRLIEGGRVPIARGRAGVRVTRSFKETRADTMSSSIHLERLSSSSI